MKRLAMIGLNHTTAPVEVRETLAFSSREIAEALRQLHDRRPDVEFVLLSTCNRTELYVAAEVMPEMQALLSDLCAVRGISDGAMAGHTFAKRGEQVVDHLFHVAASLGSMVLGETQILGQVRQAYETARAAGTARRMLHGLFQRALSVGREVMTDTELAAGRLSVASVAVDWAGQVFESLSDKNVLCVGAGKMSRLMLERLAEHRPAGLVVVNRDLEKAKRLASQFGGRARGLNELDEAIVEADLVVCGTGSRHAIVSVERLRPLLKKRRYRPICFVDIAMPRDVEPGVAKLENVYCCDLDDLQSVVSRTVAGRRGAIEQAEAIVQRHVGGYVAWHSSRDFGPAIDRLYKRHHAVAREELDRLFNKLPDLDGAARQQVEQSVRRLVNKLLHGPVTAMRHPAGGREQAYVHALEKLFQLDQPVDEEPSADVPAEPQAE